MSVRRIVICNVWRMLSGQRHNRRDGNVVIKECPAEDGSLGEEEKNGRRECALECLCRNGGMELGGFRYLLRIVLWIDVHNERLTSDKMVEYMPELDLDPQSTLYSRISRGQCPRRVALACP